MKQTSEKCTLVIYDHNVQSGNVKISNLHDFKGHPFKVERDMELFELTRSIEDKGILVPLLVRANPYGSGNHPSEEQLKAQGEQTADNHTGSQTWAWQMTRL